MVTSVKKKKSIIYGQVQQIFPDSQSKPLPKQVYIFSHFCDLKKKKKLLGALKLVTTLQILQDF